jgi:hypothetical protein
MSLNESMCSASAHVRTARMAMSVIATVLLAAAVPFAQGCATTAAPDDPETGELLLQLVQPGPGGEVYHLANATFDITSFVTGAVTTVDGSGFEPQVVVSLPPGLIDVELRDGWMLEKSVDGGTTFQPVSALLGTPNPNVVRVLANSLVFVQFDFIIRQTNGSTAISLGIVTAPRELAGGFVVQNATDGLANYNVPPNRGLDFAVFFKLFSLASVTLEDGTKQRVYTAFGQQGSFGPVPLPQTAVAAEFYNDRLGILSGPIAKELAGAFLTYTVAAKTDGTIELTGSLIGGSTDIEFGTNAIDVIVPTLDADGFPNDEFWYDSTVPFTQTSSQGSLSGLLRMRHLLPPS